MHVRDAPAPRAYRAGDVIAAEHEVAGVEVDSERRAVQRREQVLGAVAPVRERAPAGLERHPHALFFGAVEDPLERPHRQPPGVRLAEIPHRHAPRRAPTGSGR